MIKSLKVTVEESTWPAVGPAFPTLFHKGEKTCDVDITAMLLLIGHLTTPTVASGVSLSELWACVRYFFALAPTADMRLTQAFAELDSHQKTILSDDFGMGAPVAWLIEPLKLSAWCDGREFAARFAALTRRLPPKPRRRGPGKSPDFVFLDEAGRYHVVECKGTQSGSGARDRQLSHKTAKGEDSGAVVQKMMIVLKKAYQGQRLACGLSIATESGKEDSNLKVRDPEGPLKIVVNEGEEALAQDAVVRAAVARTLRAAGLSWSAAVMAAPSGVTPGDRPSRVRRRELARQAAVVERRGRAEAELQRRIEEIGRPALKPSWATRRTSIELPRVLEIDGKGYRGVEIEEGVSSDALKRLREGGLADTALMEAASWLPEAAGRLTLKSDGTFAELRLGELFRSTMRLTREAPIVGQG